MEARTPIDSITTAPVPATVPATTISAGSYISGANYRPRVGAAAAAAGVASAATPTADDDGGGAGGFAATVTGCVRSSENAHWKYRMLATGFVLSLLAFGNTHTGCLMCDIFHVLVVFESISTPQLLAMEFGGSGLASDILDCADSLDAITFSKSIIITNHSGFTTHCR